MTSPPYRYICKKCKHENWLMPHPDYFICEKCNARNKVYVFPIGNYWFTRLKDKKE